MKKADLVTRVAKDAGISKKAARVAVNCFVDSVTGALSKGDKVTLVGFGTFEVRRRAARKARNPRTGATINVPSKKVPKFNPGSKLREAVR